jgi:hypothetical protein
MEAAHLPIGAALFPDALPTDFIMQKLRGDAFEFRTAAIFASVYYSSGPLSIEIAEQLITGVGDRLLLQAMKEILELRDRASSGGKCGRCGVRGVQNQESMRSLDWLPHRV